MLFKATPKKRARKAGKKARKRAQKLGSASQERAAEFAERAGAATHDLADEVADRLRHSDALAKAQSTGSALAGRAKDRWHDAEFDDRVAEFAERVRASEAARRAAERSRAVTDASLGAVGGWLTKSKGGKDVSNRMGLQRKRRWPLLVAALAGLAGGFAVAQKTAQRPPLAGEDLFDSAERLAAPAAAPGAGTGTGTVLVDSIRSSLSSDPRTADLTELDINVAEGTVFVRGTVPPEMDRQALRDVIAAVPGVHDVDLQLVPTG